MIDILISVKDNVATNVNNSTYVCGNIGYKIKYDINDSQVSSWEENGKIYAIYSVDANGLSEQIALLQEENYYYFYLPSIPVASFLLFGLVQVDNDGVVINKTTTSAYVKCLKSMYSYSITPAYSNEYVVQDVEGVPHLFKKDGDTWTDLGIATFKIQGAGINSDGHLLLKF